MENSSLYIYIRPEEQIEDYPDSLSGDMSVFKGFRYEVQWLFYLLLRDHFKGLNLSRAYPDSGIFLIHKGNTAGFIWKPDLFVVSAQWDYPRDDRAQVHLVSNQHKTTSDQTGILDRISGCGLQLCVPPIMHPFITPRSELRGDVFENVVFIGDPKNLDQAFLTDEFQQRVAELGMKFIIQSDPHKHSDFSQADVVIAIRKIGKVINNKPAVKLYNAWRGKVPAILGCEVGYREVRQSEYDYIEVNSVAEVIAALSMLKSDPEFRRRMIANAVERGKPFSAEGQQKRWIEFFEETIIPEYEKWKGSSRFKRCWFLCVRWLRYHLRSKASYFVREVLGIHPANWR